MSTVVSTLIHSQTHTQAYTQTHSHTHILTHKQTHKHRKITPDLPFLRNFPRIRKFAKLLLLDHALNCQIMTKRPCHNPIKKENFSLRTFLHFQITKDLLFSKTTDIMCLGVSTPPSKTPPPLSCQAPLKSANCPSLNFCGNSPLYWFFVRPP